MARALKIAIPLLVLMQLGSSATALAVEAADRIIKEAPIVIRTPDGNYDQPNLDDYKSCVKRHDSCAQACNNEEACLSKCPNCPILVNEELLVQGINDTDYKAAERPAVNATNVIRLTNEIHNIIDNNLGNVVSKNENNVNVYKGSNATARKVSGGCSNDKYGMGCNEHGPCCTVISRRRRQQHCGERCQARVMYARSVVQCADEDDLSSCGHVVEYKPHRPRRVHSAPPNRCRYQQQWPFVSCQSQRSAAECSPMCLELAYGYILQHGVPLQCVHCYERLNGSQLPATPVGYAPNELPGEMADDFKGDDWDLETEKWP